MYRYTVVCSDVPAGSDTYMDVRAGDSMGRNGSDINIKVFFTILYHHHRTTRGVMVSTSAFLACHQC